MKAANPFAGSFAHAVKKGTKSHYEEVESQPALVLDESCLNQSDMSIALMGKVKTFDSLSNLKLVLAKEGFDEITLKYMGGLWAMHNVFIEERAIWVNIDGVSIKVFLVHAKEEFGWTSDFVEEEENESEYDEMVSNEGDHEENGNNTNSVVNDSDIDEKHPQSEDLFNLYDLLNKKNNKSNGGSSSNSNLKYPPGFTPSVADEDKREDLYVSGDENEIRSKYVQVEVISPCEKEKEQNRYNGWHNDIHKPVYSGGSILQVIEDMVKFLSRIFGRGKWIPNGRMILIISIYAPQELREKKMLWDYLTLVIGNWQGVVVIMGDFNEVHKQEERYGSVFNVHGADTFNMFISNAGLEEIHLGIVSACPNILALTLDRYLSDHHPILLCESKFDFGPSPFWFFLYLFEVEGFDDFVKTTWKEAQVNDHNAMRKFMNKLKLLKRKIREWTKDKRANTNNNKKILKEQLAEIDSLLDKGEGNVETLNNRADIFNSLQDIDKLESIELAQKAKIKWGIEGDENTKYYHGILNRQRNQLAIRGVLIDGTWTESPDLVKNEFFSHFQNRFGQPQSSRIQIAMDFPNHLSLEQQMDLESNITREEIKRAEVSTFWNFFIPTIILHDEPC
ncbi:RNA-directed DNA polymerase, eukaryota [Tanacetum coccineum]